MSDSVLSAEEWKAIAPDPFGVRIGEDAVAYMLDGTLHVATHEENAIASIEAPAKLIALANHALPDSDPAKITRERIRDMRETADLLQGELRRVYGPESNWGNVPMTLTAMAERVIDHADALARYLPPE